MRFIAVLIFAVLIASTAYATSITGYITGDTTTSVVSGVEPAAGAVAASNYMQDVVSSAILDLDATISASYGGSGQTWANLIPNPADGESQTAYDFWLGADGTSSTDDPTFNGSAGSAAAYFTTDSGDFFQLKSHTTFSSQMARTDIADNVWWIAACFYTPGTGNQAIAGTAGDVATANGGFAYRADINANRQVRHVDGVGGSNPGETDVANDFAINTPVCLIMTADMNATSTENRITSWTVSSTGVSNNSTNWRTVTSNATSPLTILRAGDGVNPFVADTRLYAISMGNEYLTDAKAALIAAEYASRHSRSYW